MTEITRETLFNHSMQPEQERLLILKQYFPNCFDKHGAFLPDKMAEILHSDGIHTQKEGYSLNWLGKSYAKLLKDTPPETLLAEDTEHNRLPENENSENLLIKGDNLEVLKHLKHAYKNQVKMIYIDPPYNTGSDGFVYQDDRKFTPEQLAELGGISLEEAERVLAFTAKKSNSHSAWLTFMYPRLYVARELLREDGVIFISIDDNEQAQLKLLCDDVFGEENFVAQMIWQQGRKSAGKNIAINHEYCFIYAKSITSILENIDKGKNYWKRKKIGIDELYLEEKRLRDKYGNNFTEINREYKIFLSKLTENDLAFAHRHYNNIDEFGIYFPADAAAPDKPETRCHKPLIHPITGKSTATPRLGWRYSEKTLLELYEQNQFHFGCDETTIPCIKRYLINTEYEVAQSVFYKDGRGASNRLSSLFGNKKIFDFPKDEFVITDFIKLVSLQNQESDLILDFFAGSGTTAHAVMQLNAEDNGNRRFICVQLPEKTDEKSEAYKAGYQTIFDITKERIIRSAAKIRTEHPDYSGDLGLKIFETVPLFDFQAALKTDFDPIQANLPYTTDTALSDEQLHTLLTTWRVYDGSRLPEKVQAIDLAGYTAYYCRNHLYLLASGFYSECVKALIEKLDNDKDFVPERIVLLSANIESAMQKELKQAVETYANKKGLNNLSVLARD